MEIDLPRRSDDAAAQGREGDGRLSFWANS